MSNQKDEKRVKFSEEIVSEDEQGNDLDLDTIRASKNKTAVLKEFDSEGSEDEEAEVEDKREYNFDSVSDESSISAEEEDERQVPLMPFNLKEDREEGNFDSDGFYTRKQDEEADQDRWMANFTKSDIIKARKAHEKQQEKKMVKNGVQRSEEELWKELAGLLEENDLTVLQAIRQITVKQEDQKPRAPLNKNRLKKLGKEQQQQQQVNILSAENKAKMEKLTELADALMDFGNFGVYEETRRSMLRKLSNKE